MRKVFPQVINNCEDPVLFGLSEGCRGIALSLTACAVSLRTLLQGRRRSGGQVTGANSCAGQVHRPAICRAVLRGYRGLQDDRAKSQKPHRGAPKSDPHPFAREPFPHGGWRACRGGLPQHYYHLIILITFVVY